MSPGTRAPWRKPAGSLVLKTAATALVFRFHGLCGPLTSSIHNDLIVDLLSASRAVEKKWNDCLKRPISNPEGLDAATAIEGSLKKAIEAGTLEVGSRLTQQGLADFFETSRMPVRQALLMLEVQGYVVNQRHRGYVVSSIPPESESSSLLGPLLDPLKLVYLKLSTDEARLAFERMLIQLIRR